MRFFYSDTMDLVDPGYNFQTDSSPAGRERYWDDKYAHEILESAPYDGLLISMSSIRKSKKIGSGVVKYSPAEEQRLLRDGARKFLRLEGEKYRKFTVMGDCGAFAYSMSPEPAYSVEEVLEFYQDTGVDLGVAPDHIVFECDLDNPDSKSCSKVSLERYELTLSNAEKFLRLRDVEGCDFTPLATVQGWSPASMADAAAALVKMGYSYLAIGGLVPLGPDAIEKILIAVRDRIGSEVRLHLLGFAKADSIERFVRFNVTSLDSTSPLIRAFKDSRRNYYIDLGNGGLDYYMAIRVPQSLENPTLMQAVKRGELDPDDLVKKERIAMEALRDYGNKKLGLDATVDRVLDYSKFLSRHTTSPAKLAKELSKSREGIVRTLSDRPWESCRCSICRDIGIQVVVFRASNRNKRRGMHNLGVYYEHLRKISSEATA